MEGTLYPLLTRLKTESFSLTDGKNLQEDHPEKYYQITEKRKTFLDELLNTWNELTASVKPNHPTKLKNKAMNKTLSIGLAGFSFTIEEHAYIKLSDYLNALRSSLDASEADEVMHDIEIRMVEIFKDSLGKREVINDTDVEKVIAQIGTLKKIEEQEEAYFSEKHLPEKNIPDPIIPKKQLFRDPEKQKVAGFVQV